MQINGKITVLDVFVKKILYISENTANTILKISTWYKL